MPPQNNPSSAPRPRAEPVQDVAIVGAGLAGLSCAKSLAAYGVRVTLFDKGRRPGGRLATRRVEVAGQVFSFDHGAQYLTARGPGFAAVLDAANAAVWPDGERRVGMPRMSAVSRALADGLSLDEVVRRFKRAGVSLPKSVSEQFRTASRRFGRVRMYQSLTVLELVDELAARELAANTSLMKHVLYRISPHAFVLLDEAVDDLIEEMQAKGYTPRTR